MGLHAGIPFGNGRHGARPVSSRPLLIMVSGERCSGPSASGTLCSEVAGHHALNLEAPGLTCYAFLFNLELIKKQIKNKNCPVRRRSRSVNGLALGFWLQDGRSGKHI